MNYKDSIEFFKSYLKQDKVKVINPSKMKDVASTYKILERILLLEQECTSIEIKEGALELGDIYIRIITPQFTVYNLSLFSAAIEKADNIDIYPTADTRIKIDIMFNNAYIVTTIK